MLYLFTVYLSVNKHHVSIYNFQRVVVFVNHRGTVVIKMNFKLYFLPMFITARMTLDRR
jgi:hypothetical protein